MNKKYYQIAGLFGTICFASGLGFFLVKREFSIYVLLNILIGVMLIGVFLYYNIKDLTKLFVTSGKKGSKDILLKTGLILGILVLLNMFSNLFYFGFDLTKEKVSSISDYSKKIVQWIKEPVEILIFSNPEGREYEKFLLESYNFCNKQITYRFLDPERNPQLAQEYGVVKAGQTVVKYKDRVMPVESISEQSVTNAIIRLTQSVKNSVYFMMMHGEHVVDDYQSNQGYGLLWKELQNENYSVYKLKLEPPNYYIPGNCTILVVAGPRKMFTGFEIKAIKEYLENNGRAIFMLDPNINTGLEGLISEWGIAVDDDCMIDVVYPSLVERLMARMNGKRIFPHPVFKVIARDFPQTDITRDIMDKSIIMSVARSLSRTETGKADFNLQVEPLALTTDKGWGETNLEDLFKSGQIAKGADEKLGPLTVAMLSTKGPKEANSRIIVFGDSDFVNNEFLNQLYNRDFFMNSLAYLSNQATLISVRQRNFFASRIDYDPLVMSRIFTISVLILPQLFLMIGIAIWWLRR